MLAPSNRNRHIGSYWHGQNTPLSISYWKGHVKLYCETLKSIWQQIISDFKNQNKGKPARPNIFKVGSSMVSSPISFLVPVESILVELDHSLKYNCGHFWNRWSVIANVNPCKVFLTLTNNSSGSRMWRECHPQSLKLNLVPHTNFGSDWSR